MDEFLLLSAICSGDLNNFSDVGLCGGVPLFGTTTTWALNWRISWSFNFKILRASSSSLVKLNLLQVSTSLKKVSFISINFEEEENGFHEKRGISRHIFKIFVKLHTWSLKFIFTIHEIFTLFYILTSEGVEGKERLVMPPPIAAAVRWGDSLGMASGFTLRRLLWASSNCLTFISICPWNKICIQVYVHCKLSSLKKCCWVSQGLR